MSGRVQSVSRAILHTTRSTPGYRFDLRIISRPATRPMANVAPEPVVRTGLTAGGRWIRTSGSAQTRTTPGSASCAPPGQSNAPAARPRLERDQAGPGFGEEGGRRANRPFEPRVPAFSSNEAAAGLETATPGHA